MSRPTATGVAKYYPDRAERTGISGRAILSCRARGDGTLADCSVLQEDPAGHEFGAAALNLAHLFRMPPLTSERRSVVGAQVTIPIRFQASRAPAPPPLYIRPVQPPSAPFANWNALAIHEGDRLLAAGRVPGLFDNLTESGWIRLRHRPSGIVCTFALGGANSIVATRKSGSDEPAAIRCMTSVAGVSNRLTIEPDRGNLGAEQALERAVASARAASPGLAPFSGAMMDLQQQTASPIRSARLQAVPGGPDTFVYLGVTLTDGWLAVEHASGLAEKAEFTDRIGQAYLISATRNLRTGFGAVAGAIPPPVWVRPAIPPPRISAIGQTGLDAALIGPLYSGSVTIGGYVIPLPDGDWALLSDNPSKLTLQNGADVGEGSIAYFGRIRSRRLTGLVSVWALHTTRGTLVKAREGSIPLASCELPGALEQAHLSCFTTSYIFLGNWRRWADSGAGLPPGERAPARDLAAKGVEFPSDMVSARFWQAEAGGVLKVDYAFSPEAEGIVSTPVLAVQDGDWTPEHIKSFPEKRAYLEKITVWGRAMSEGEKGFRGACGGRCSLSRTPNYARRLAHSVRAGFALEPAVAGRGRQG